MSPNCITLPIIQVAINNVACLFSLPEIYLHIRELMEDKNSDLDDFAKVVGTDPNLSVSVLKIVNSAYFGFTGQIDNIPRALNLLGIGALHDLVLSISAVGSLSMPNEIMEMSRFWRRSIYCGVLSRLIAEDKKLKESGNLFVIGLLHEIGHLLFFYKFPLQYTIALTESVQTNRMLFQTELEMFGAHYGLVGQLLMKKWNLPKKFQVITEFHPEPAKAHEYLVETAIVHIAHNYAIAKESGDDPQFTIDPQAWQLLDSSPEIMNEILDKTDLMSSELEQLIVR
jgi:HD-like signal output (HDOD) protein